MIEYEYRVTWFPPQTYSVTKTGSEEHVKRLAAAYAEWNPIIERRPVTEWEACA